MSCLPGCGGGCCKKLRTSEKPLGGLKLIQFPHGSRTFCWRTWMDFGFALGNEVDSPCGQTEGMISNDSKPQACSLGSSPAQDRALGVGIFALQATRCFFPQARRGDGCS